MSLFPTEWSQPEVHIRFVAINKLTVSVPCCIHVSEPAKNLALKTNQGFVFKERGLSKIEVSFQMSIRFDSYFLGKRRSTIHVFSGKEHKKDRLGTVRT